MLKVKNINENAKKVLKDGKLGDIPLVILTAGQDYKWKASQIELKDWSNNSKQEDITGANHYIHWSNWKVVKDRIQELVDNSKKNVH